MSISLGRQRQRVFESVIGGVYQNDLFADQRVAIVNDGTLEIYRGVSAGMQCDDVQNCSIVGIAKIEIMTSSWPISGK